MDPAEYANLERVERDHWYYAGKRELARRWLQRFGPIRRDAVLLDCGAGTGRFAQEMQAHCRVLVLDDHEESLRLLRKRFAPEQVLALTGSRLPLDDASVDYVTALDVLEHVPEDRAAVEEFARVVRPGGLVLVTVPASMSLWSDWDERLHHFRRYHRRQLQELFPAGAWQRLHVNYTNTLAYPAVWGVRRWRRSFPAGDGAARTEDQVPPGPVNRLLRHLFVRTGLSRVPFPIGVSLLLVARRR